MVEKLPQGTESILFKYFDEKGVEPSGGEQQKIALARALNKDAPVVILDEPTSALDPLAKYEIYRHFNELIEKKQHSIFLIDYLPAGFAITLPYFTREE